jgi:acetyltransferase
LAPDTTSAAIAALLCPRSIAIAGASSDPARLGSLPLAFLVKHGYRGKIYPINPNVEQIHGIACFKSLAEIAEPIDLLVVAVAAARVNALFDECRDGQVRAAIVLSSGFSELGGEGDLLQASLARSARAKGIRFIGPNSVGVANLAEHFVASISQAFDQVEAPPGSVGFVTQSGAVGTAITALAHAEHIGISCFVSTGNEGDLEFADICDHFADDPSIRIIAGYIESIRDGAKFRAAAARAASAGKPVILMKVGTTDVGGRAVRSHTGAFAGSEQVYRAAFEQAGIVRAGSIEELIDLLKVFASASRPRIAVGGRGRVAILSHSGGAGVLMADTCADDGCDVAAPSARLAGELGKRLPSYASLQNPIDMTANVIFDPALIGAVMRQVIESREYDAALLCVNLIWRQGEALANELKSLAAASDCLPAVTWIAGRREHVFALEQSGVPVFSDPVRCARAVAMRLRWEARPRPGPGTTAASRRTRTAPGNLGAFDARERLLRGYGIPLARAMLAGDFESARRAASEIGYPVALKLVAASLAHKSEIGGVHLGIAAERDLRARFDALDAIPIADKEGILVQQMVEGPLEIFVGMTRDPVFGPVVVVGIGGIYVEIIKETVLRLAPVDAAAATEMLRAAKFFPLLDGARGRPRLDVAALAAILSGVSELACAERAVASLDLNPIILREHGAEVVDFKLEYER